MYRPGRPPRRPPCRGRGRDRQGPVQRGARQGPRGRPAGHRHRRGRGVPRLGHAAASAPSPPRRRTPWRQLRFPAGSMGPKVEAACALRARRHPARSRRSARSRTCRRSWPARRAPASAPTSPGPPPSTDPPLGSAGGRTEADGNGLAAWPRGGAGSSAVGHLDIARVTFALPDGRVLLDDVSFRVGEGAKVALVGANGAGKTTLLRIVAGDLDPHAGAVTRSGGLGVMRQFVGSVRDDDRRCATCCSSVAPPRVRDAPRPRSSAAELALMERRRRAHPAARTRRRSPDWADAGGYDIEVLWDTCCTERARASPYDQVRVARGLARCPAASRSGSCWRRCCAGRTRCCCSTSRTTTSTCRASAGWRSAASRRPKTVLFVCHDRELLARTATADRHGRARRRRQHGVDARPAGFADLPRGARATASTGSRSCAGAGTRSTPSSRPWC